MASPHSLLLKCRDDDAEDDALVSEITRAIGDVRLELGRMHVHRAVTAREVYAYLEIARPDRLSSGDVLELAVELRAHPALSNRMSEIDALEIQFEVPGASTGEAARFHYVVEMDPEVGWQDEIVRWYDTEHMPGLAAAPGCVRARRFLNHGGGPLSFACYDLTRAETTETAPWLAVRHTPWSDRVRPHFQNPKRTMFRTVADRVGGASASRAGSEAV